MEKGKLIIDGPVLLNIKENGVATITMNRPDTFNSLNDEMSNAFQEVLYEIETRSDIKVVVWTGSGKALSAGGDVRMLQRTTSIQEARKKFERAYVQNKRFYNLPMPVIVGVNGTVAGVCTGRCLAADIIIAAESAKFAANFINIGFIPDGGTSYFLFKKLGHHHTADILYNGRILTSEECLDLGIFTRVVPDECLYSVVYEMADKLAASPAIALKYMKQVLRSAVTADFPTIASMEAGCQIQCWSSDDFQEGINAFLEKRKPHFKGK